MTLPVHRTILALDIEHSTSPLRANPVKERLRRDLYQLLNDALRAAGIASASHDPLIDRGDGVLLLVRASDALPKTRLLSPFIPALTSLLASRNSSLPAEDTPGMGLRLRAVLHAGELHHDSHGPFGESLDLAFRLLDAPRVKADLRDASVPLALVVSAEIYWSIVRHNYDGIPASSFRPIVRVRAAGRRHQGWVQLPEPPVSCHGDE